MENTMINNKIDELRALEMQIALLGKQAEAIKNELKGELDSRKVDSVDTGLHKVFYTVYEKASIDSAKLKAEGLYEKFCKSSLVTQFKITDKKCPA